jgi:hypothetical protein
MHLGQIPHSGLAGRRSSRLTLVGSKTMPSGIFGLKYSPDYPQKIRLLIGRG